MILRLIFFFVFFLFHYVNSSACKKIVNFDFVINVFTWNRISSLKRLTDSLIAAEYLNYNVSITFYIEHNFPLSILNYIQSINWKHGQKSIVIRKNHYGLEKNIVNSWNPISNDQYAFFFEDDIEVNSRFFLFIEKILKDTYCRKELVGISLNTPNYDEVNIEGSIWQPEIILKKKENLFLFQQPSSWGALYFPVSWRNFLKYYRIRKTLSLNEIVPCTKINRWIFSWKKYFMEYMIIYSKMMLYPSFSGGSFSCHHNEPGVHFKQIQYDFYKTKLLNDSISDSFLKKYNLNMKTIRVFSFYHTEVKNISDIVEYSELIKNSIKSVWLFQ